MKDLINYVQPHGDLPQIAWTKSGSLLIIGCAVCVWDDLASYDHLHEGDRMGINDIIIHYQGPNKLQHGASLHPDVLATFIEDSLFCTHSIFTHKEQPKYVWHLKRDGGTSGLFGVLIGLLMGYDKIILAGSPIDSNPNFYNAGVASQVHYGTKPCRDEWLRARDAVFRGRVKSLSGNTRDWLGEP
jgi:hypothetical protein